MSARLWVFSALDTWFFRDGAPFNAGEGSQSNVKGVFPPFMNTLQGAIRTVLAEGQGWTPEAPHRWPQELGTADHLGNLRLRGPYLMWGDDFLFAPPSTLLGVETRSLGATSYRFTLLHPGEPVECDVGEMRLPTPRMPLEGAKPLVAQWLTRVGMEAVLKGDEPPPEEVRSTSELWRFEPRVGIERNHATRTVEEGQLYSSFHVRPLKATQLGVLVAGIPDDWHPRAPVVARLGGEGRLARVEVRPPSCPDQGTVLPAMPVIKGRRDGRLRFTVTLVTPGYYDDTARAVRQGPPDMPGACISACIGKLQQTGGWDLLNKRPRPLRPLIPPGSTWFFEASETEHGAVRSLHGKCLGMATDYGFGQVIIGTWGDGV